LTAHIVSRCSKAAVLLLFGGVIRKVGGEIRDRTNDNQQHRASSLNLLVTAIVLWNTRYLERAVAALRESEHIPDHPLAHLSPLGWEHVNSTGDYVWGASQCCR
jgi:Tn3 transposase DDE domain